MNSFEQFWSVYPHRVGKLAAQKAFEKALKSATPEDIIAGVQRYARTKPGWQTWAHPSTWLNAGRWMDEITTAPTLTDVFYDWTCPHDPPCYGRNACAIKSALATGRAS